ncbi:MAG: glycerate kinase, partial [Opitutales bacterium]
RVLFRSQGSFDDVEVRDPRCKKVKARLGFVRSENLSSRVIETAGLPSQGRIAVIEMAAAAGLHLLDRKDRDPWKTSTHGVGDLMAYASQKKVDAILLGIGGSATNDLGFGALQTLGIRFLDEAGESIDGIRPFDWPRLVQIDGSLIDLPPVRIACDVENPLMGPSGATAVYGRQKGFDDRDLAHAEKELNRVAQLLAATHGADGMIFNEPGAGAAGGLGFGLRVVSDATFVSGFNLFSAWLGLNERVTESDWVITGEGRFDFSSLQGKGPCSVAKMAARKGASVLILAGSVDQQAAEELQAICPEIKIHSISRPELSLQENLRETPKRLAKVLQELIETEHWNRDH